MTLIKSVLSSLLTYFMSLFKMPEGIAKTVDRLQSNFLWGDSEKRKKIHLVGWEKVSSAIK